MISGRQDAIRAELQSGTGAAIDMSIDQTGVRTGLRLWFADLGERHGPIAELRPYGMHGYRVTVGLGKFAGEIVRQIQSASEEDVALARALVASIDPDVVLELSGQDRNSWHVSSGAFKITATTRGLLSKDDEAVRAVCRDIIVPVMAAMAELIGYDVIVDEEDFAQGFEGAVLVSILRRRERNPRNRLLCIRLHGEKCGCCGLDPKSVYGDEAGGIIEVHHLQPLSQLSVPRPYDPELDLIPLCPNCHRAVHTRRPIPLSISELRLTMPSPGHMEAAG